MKRTLFCLVFLSLSALFAVSLNAQTRQRRVLQNPQLPTTDSSSPSRAPVLGGATRTAGTRPDGQPAEAASGPEEVDAGDVIRVNTTLVTLPVAVMDRDGRYIPNLRKEDFRLWRSEERRVGKECRL